MLYASVVPINFLLARNRSGQKVLTMGGCMEPYMAVVVRPSSASNGKVTLQHSLHRLQAPFNKITTQVPPVFSEKRRPVGTVGA